MWFVKTVAGLMLLWGVTLLVNSWITASSNPGRPDLVYFATALFQVGGVVFGATLLIALASIYDRIGDAMRGPEAEGDPEPVNEDRASRWMRSLRGN